MAKHDSNIDPFNAGEPVLPWDDPEAMHDDECSFDGGADYRAPSKERDDYEASAPDALDASDAPSRTPRVSRRKASGPSRPSTPPKDEPVSSKKSAWSRFFKIFAIVFVLSAVVSLISGIASCSVDLLDSVFDGFNDDYNWHEDYDEEDYVITTPIDEEASEEEVRELAASTLGSLAENESFCAYIWDSFGERCTSYLDCSAEQLGIEREDYVAAALDGFSYEISSCYAFNGVNGEYPNASCYMYTSACSLANVESNFVAEAYEYCDERGVDPSSNELTPSQQEDLRAILDEAFAQSAPDEDDEDNFNVIDFVCINDSWQLDPNSYLNDLGFIFSLW